MNHLVDMDSSYTFVFHDTVIRDVVSAGLALFFARVVIFCDPRDLRRSGYAAGQQVCDTAM